ncbi:MAG: ATP-dependent metallopeptidase FtsH/Yme1/Tma family protein [Candidatus Marinimicrobia bacterium]|nr:ATP-dependent metallopeptidase FtsH/Yme1/Tma family protein [Candidatus Neomarinimicrobiota bacterium]
MANDKNDHQKKYNTPKKTGSKNKKLTGGNEKFWNFWSNGGKTTIIWLIIVLAAISIMQFYGGESKTKVVSFTEFIRYVEDDKVQSAEIVGNKFVGTLKQPEEQRFRSVKQVYEKFSTTLPYVDSELINKWNEKEFPYQFKESSPGMIDYLINFSPWILIIFLWIFFMKRMQGSSGQSGIFGFIKSRAKLIPPDQPKTTFKDVAGCDEAKVELEEIVQFLKNPKKYSKLGAKIPKGALLLGPPGTGKTLLAKAVSGEAGVPFFSISGAEFVEMFVGVGASRVRDLFDQAKKSSPSIIFIDEIDAVGRHRGAGLGGGHDEREQTLNQILVEMDGFDTDINVILLAATNRPDVLDKALLRPGRFDRQIVVDVPGIDGREAILKIHSKNVPLGPDVVLKTVAKGTPGLVGADLENLVNEAALLAARKNRKFVTMMDFEEAKDKVMMGVERKSMILTPEEKNTTAIHEAGHALVAFHTEGSDPVHKITIIPRGRALGLTAQLPDHEKHNYNKNFLNGQLYILMGGRMAEKLIFNDYSTGAANDIEVATNITRKMVCEWGMSDKIGPLTFGKKSEEVFLGREISHSRDYSDDMSKTIDSEITLIVRNAEKQAGAILEENRDQLVSLAEALLEYETISGTEMELLLSGGDISTLRNQPVKKRRRRSNRRKSSNAAPQNTEDIKEPANEGSTP